MPNFARISQTDGTADYANTVLWEAGEESSNYGSVTVGIQEDLYSPAGGLRIDGSWPNGFQLIAKVGEEASASDITQGAGFVAGSGQFIDVRVPNGEFKNIRIEGVFLRIIGTSTNTKLTNCVARGVIQPSIADDLALDNTLFLSDGVADSISIRDTPATLNKSTVISLNDIGGHVIRSRGSAVVGSNDSVCFAPNTATSFLAFIAGTFTGDYNAGHTGGSTPGANSITNLTRTLVDVFTNPAGNDYTPKVGGPLDGASSTGGFIGAFAPTASGISIVGDTASFDYNALAGTVDLTGKILVTGSTASFDYTAINGSVDLTGQLLITGDTANFDYTALPGDVDLTGEIIVTGSTANFDYAGENGVVELGAVINVVGQTANFDFNGVDAEVLLTGEITIIGDTATFNYQALSGLVVVGQGQKIGTVTAGFAESTIGVQYKQNTITVNFGE